MDLSKLQPLRDGLVVKLLPEPPTSFLITPDVAAKRSHIGQVIAVGPGKRDDKGRLKPMEVKVGMVVRFSLNDYEDGDYTLIREGDIFGMVDGKEA